MGARRTPGRIRRGAQPPSSWLPDGRGGPIVHTPCRPARPHLETELSIRSAPRPPPSHKPYEGSTLPERPRGCGLAVRTVASQATYSGSNPDNRTLLSRAGRPTLASVDAARDPVRGRGPASGRVLRSRLPDSNRRPEDLHGGCRIPGSLAYSPPLYL